MAPTRGTIQPAFAARFPRKFDVRACRSSLSESPRARIQDANARVTMGKSEGELFPPTVG